jgi:hypothetical protein
MDIVSHILYPVVFAQSAYGYGARDRKTDYFNWKHLLLIGLAGGLPDLLFPHFTFEGRLGSLTHSIWFLLAAFIVSASLIWRLKNFRLLVCFCYFALAFHLLCDLVSGGINLLAPSGDFIVGGNYVRIRYWNALDVIAVLFFIYSWLYNRYHARARSVVLASGLIVCMGGSVFAISRIDTEDVLLKRVPLREMDGMQLEKARQSVHTLFTKWQAGIYAPLSGDFSEETQVIMTPHWQESFFWQIQSTFGEYRGIHFAEMVTARFSYPHFLLYRFKGSFSRMPQEPEIRISFDSKGKIAFGWSDKFSDRLMDY